MLRHLLSADKKFSGSLKNLLGFYPKNLSLYQMAFRHKSVARIKGADTSKTSNERLEFLGDALLNAIVAEHLFRRFPYKDEGFLTKLRSKIVSRNHLNNIAIKMGIQDMLNKEQGGYPGSSIYGNALEALIGAVYLDTGYIRTKNFILNRVFVLYVDMDEVENTETDFKSRLIEWAQKERKSIEFKIMEEAQRSDNKTFHIGLFIDQVIRAEASHTSKKRAEQIAAEKAWTLIENPPVV